MVVPSYRPLCSQLTAIKHKTHRSLYAKDGCIANVQAATDIAPGWGVGYNELVRASFVPPTRNPGSMILWLPKSQP